MGEADTGQGREVSQDDGKRVRLFKTLWRPMAGWVCVGALAWWFILRDLVAWAVYLHGVPGNGPNPVSLDDIITVLMALLGLGTMRTIEKLKGGS